MYLNHFSQVSVNSEGNRLKNFKKVSKRTRSNRKAFRKGIERKGSCVDQLREDLVVEVVERLELEE